MSITIIRYRFILKHSSLGDVQIPISSFSARLRSGSPSYLSVTIPYTADRLTKINDRVTGGILRVDKVYVDRSYRTLLWVNLDDIRWDDGPSSKTITLSGNYTHTNSSPTTVTLQDYSYIRHSDSKLVRCSVRNDPKPADTIVAGTVSFTAGLVSVYANSQNSQVEITEVSTAATTTTTVSTTTTTQPPP